MARTADGMPDPRGATDLAEFIGLLGRLRIWAGAPSYRTLAKRVGLLLRPPQAVSQSTITDLFQPHRRRLNLDLVVATVRALGLAEPDVAHWRAACVAMHVEPRDSGRPTGALRQLPAELTTFTGREAAVEHLTQTSIQSGDQHVVVISTIEGMAGVGKTQLAVRAAHELVRAGRYTDAQLFVNLRGFDPDRPPADPAAVLDWFLRALGVPPETIPMERDARAGMFRSLMHEKSGLLVLDNAADEEQVRDLMPASASCLVLITSRHSLAGLDGATHYQLDMFSRSEAVQLLKRIVGAGRVEAEPAVAVEIVEACGLLPMAVSLVAARLRARRIWRLADLAGYLRDGGVDAVSAGGRSLRQVFDLSFDGLPKSAQRMFCLLGVAPGADITVPAAAALADASTAAARGLLELLHDENLLLQKTPGRYEFHDLLRAYAADRASTYVEGDERQTAVHRILTWYMVTMDAAATAMGPNRRSLAIPAAESAGYSAHFASSAEAMDWCEWEHANLLDAVESASTHALPYLAWRLPVDTSAFLQDIENWEESERISRLGMEAVSCIP
jgi:hypothetical protein